MSEMIDRVARAISASDFDGDTNVYDTMSDAMRENFTINARAAIEAMRDSLDVGFEAAAQAAVEPFHDIPKDVWAIYAPKDFFRLALKGALDASLQDHPQRG